MSKFHKKIRKEVCVICGMRVQVNLGHNETTFTWGHSRYESMGHPATPNKRAVKAMKRKEYLS